MYLKFKARYFELNQSMSSSSLLQPTSKKSKAGGLKKLIRQVQSDSEDDMPPNAATASAGDPLRPWRAEFLSYIETLEAALPAGMSTIQWWGVSIVYYTTPKLVADHIPLKINAQRYLVWASLARDYLSIMSSSVSSERAFSSGGITISKRRNRLKGDIVEALQCVKCSLRHDLLFRETGPSSLTEDNESEAEDEAGEKSAGNSEDEEGWDTLILEDSDDEDDGADGDDENDDEHEI